MILIRVTSMEENMKCRRCRKEKNDVQERYSYGVYAGILCIPCCSSYRDNCGVDQPQGDPQDLDEVVEPEDYY